MKLKNIILGFGLAIGGLFAQAQTGLENVIVERFYVSTAADAAAAAAASAGVLPVGSVTYRIYADMLPGYKWSAAFGSPQHLLKIHTSTAFYNNEAEGANVPSYNKAKCALNTVMLDSWLSVGAACTNNFGVPLSEDNATGGTTVVHPTGVLTTLTANDGLWAGAPQTLTYVGPPTSPSTVDYAEAAFGAANFPAVGTSNDFTLNDGAWTALSGAIGPIPATNRVLIGQFTTDGIFSYELNFQVQSPALNAEKFVAKWDPATDPFDANATVTLKSFMADTLYPTPQFPTVNLTGPANGSNYAPFAPITFTATAADVDGTVSQVEFFVDGISIGVDVDGVAPWIINLAGGLADNIYPYSISAKATDNNGQVTTSAAISINVGNAAPVFDSFTKTTSIPNGVNYVAGDAVSFAATAHDTDGNVISLQLFDGAVALGSPVTGSTPSLSGTFNVANLTVGTHTFTVKATDNGTPGKVSISSPIVIVVSANVLPIVAIDAPISGANVDLAADLAISATATDADGTVTSVEFFKGAVSLGVGSKNGNVFSATVPAANLVVGPMSITAVATDNKGGVRTSAIVTFTVKNNSVAYEIAGVRQECYIGNTCMKVNTVASVSGVIGYNFTIAYDKTKVNPTGVVTVSPALLGGIAANQTSVDTYIDAAAGTIAVSIYFKGSAPVTAAFNGIGEICCVQFDQLPAFTGDATTTLSFTSPGVTESYPTLVSDVDGQAGTFEIFRDWFLFSNLKNWSDNQAIKYDPLNTGDYLVSNILGSSPQALAPGAAVQPDLNGTFKYDIRNGLTIDIQRDILNTTLVNSVIEGNDALLASRVSIGVPLATYTPAIYNIIAMDVNRDTRITAGDATQINRRAVLAIQEFTQVGGEHKDWLFVAKTVAVNNPAYSISTTYPLDNGVGFSRARVPYISKFQDVKYNANYQVCPDLRTSEDYLGVMLGDADETYEGIANNGQLKVPAAEITSEIVIDLSKAIIVDGNIQLPVSLKCAEAVNSYSFQLTLNDNVLVNNIVSTVNANLDWNYISEYKALLVSTYISGNTSIPTANTIANISVDGIASLSINDLKGVTSKINGKDANVVIIDAVLGVPEQGKDNLIKVYPNPATDRVNVETSVDSKIKMYDFNGKQVINEQDVNANQQEAIDVSNLVPGVYMIKVYNDKFVKMQKVVIK